MEYLKSVVGGIIGAILALISGLFIPIVAVCILIAGLCGAIKLDNK
jgi:hypothetical protein